MNKYKYYMHCLPNVGDATIYKLLDEALDAKNVYHRIMDKEPKILEVLKKNLHSEDKVTSVIKQTKAWDVDDKYEEMLSRDIAFITIDDNEYPKRLYDIATPPYALYVKGSIPENDIPSVAIIGARNCSEYGTFIANAFGESIAKYGINIISGMARGVDGISQRGALNADGRTYAVLGSGVDVCYPASNFKLYRAIQDKGGIISVFPPGAEPLRQHFPERNKIVAALSDIVLVVEAKIKSGTAITVDLALRMGKDIYAVPGRLTDRLSDGCNRLIRDGAGIALSPEDIINEVGVVWKRLHPDSELFSEGEVQNVENYAPKKDEGILKYLDATPRSVEEIHNRRIKDDPGFTMSQTMSELVMLSISGAASQIGTGYFYRVLNL